MTITETDINKEVPTVLSGNPRQRLTLGTGSTVLSTIYFDVDDRATAFLSGMIPGHRYSAETILGYSVAEWRNPVLRREASESLADMVASGSLPLEFAYMGKKATHMYELDAEAYESWRFQQ